MISTRVALLLLGLASLCIAASDCGIKAVLTLKSAPTPGSGDYADYDVTLTNNGTCAVADVYVEVGSHAFVFTSAGSAYFRRSADENTGNPGGFYITGFGNSLAAGAVFRTTISLSFFNNPDFPTTAELFATAGCVSSCHAASASNVKAQLNAGSNAWYFAVKITNLDRNVTAVSLRDHGAYYADYVALTATTYGEWYFAPSQPLVLPISLRISVAGSYTFLEALNVISAFDSSVYDLGSTAPAIDTPATTAPTSSPTDPTSAPSTPTTAPSSPTTAPGTPSPAKCQTNFVSTETNRWTEGANTYYQFDVTIKNIGSTPITRAVVAVGARSVLPRELWNLEKDASGQPGVYTLPSYALPLRPSASFTFGYIAAGPVPFQTSATDC